MKSRFVAVVVALWLGAAAVPASVIYVRAAASGANTGADWANAYTDLQSALAAAASGAEIWVAAGTYKPTSGASRAVSFAMKDGVALYGGFAGTETLRSQRNVAANPTVLSGDIGTVGVASDNSFHVVRADNTVTATGVLDGFTVTGGNANGSNPDDRGGGLLSSAGSPTIANCIFSGNSAGRGGALRVDGGSVTVSGTAFQGNSTTTSGGAVAAGSVTSLRFTSCSFVGNSVGNSTGGGAIEATNSVTVVNGLVAGNSPNGVVFYGDSNAFVNTTISANFGYGATFFGNGNSLANSVLWGDPIAEINLGISGDASASYCDVQGGYAGTGNIASDPKFVNAGAGNYRLAAGSPAVDAGNNAAVPGGVTTDLAGLPRFFDDPAAPNTGAGTPPLVDMGAYERVPLSVTAPAPQTVCTGGVAGFSVTASGQGPFTYRWRLGMGNLSDGGDVSGAFTSSLTISPATAPDAGSYDVVVKDSFGQSQTSASAALSLYALPTAAVSGGGTICAGASSNIQAALTGTGPWNVTWSDSVSQNSVATSPAMRSVTPGATTVYTVTAVNDAHCAGTSSGSATVTVDPTPSAAITAPSSVFGGAPGNTASVPDAGNSATYSWVVTNGTVTAGAGTRTVTFTAGAKGSVTLQATVQTAAGCSAGSSKTIPIIAISRVFVSATGNDSNDCSSVATPCRTFGGAIAQVDAGGEVIVRSSGSYGDATIDKAVTISAPPGIVAFTGQPILVAAGASDTVILRGLVSKAATPGSGAGIYLSSAGALFVQGCVFSGWQYGMYVGLSSAILAVSDSVVRDCSQGGIYLQNARATLDRVTVQGNGGNIVVAGGSAEIRRSVISGASQDGVLVLDGSDANIADCLISGNLTGVSVRANSLAASAHISSSIVTDNGTGFVQFSLGVLLSRGDNTLEGNGTNVSGTVGSYTPK
jgi:predicted outer membrane repeat protein